MQGNGLPALPPVPTAATTAASSGVDAAHAHGLHAPAVSGASALGPSLGPVMAADPHPGRLYVLVMGARNLPEGAFASSAIGAAFGATSLKSAFVRLKTMEQPDRK